MGKDDIYQETYDNIVQLCIGCSRASTRTRSGMRAPLTKNSNITSGVVTRSEVDNLLEIFKTNILSTLITQLDVLQARQKQLEAEQTLAIFFHRCDAGASLHSSSQPATSKCTHSKDEGRRSLIYICIECNKMV
jgi:hypothetical protein